MKDPQRLSDQTDLPDALHEALRGLGHDAPPADAVTRIQRSLSALPAPPGLDAGASIATKFWSSGAFKVAAVAVGAAAVVATVATVAMRTSAPVPVPRARTSAVEVPIAADAIPPLAADGSAPPTAAPHLPGAYTARASASAQPERRNMSESAPQKRTQRGNDRRDKAAVELAPAIAAVSHQPAMPEPADAQVAQPQQVSPRAQKQALPAPEDEASLLYRAKKAARTDRRSALRMLDQHAAYFPHGALVEEREVLAIDLLRRLGREQEAKQRSAQFLQQFPHSSYRSAIAR